MSDSLRPHGLQHARLVLSITSSWSLLKLMSIQSVMPSSRLILCRPLLLLPPIPSSIRVFSKELVLRIRWPKHWSFSFSITQKYIFGALWRVNLRAGYRQGEEQEMECLPGYSWESGGFCMRVEPVEFHWNGILLVGFCWNGAPWQGIQPSVSHDVLCIMGVP